MVADININMEIQFGERVGHGGWLIGPKLFRPEAYLTCVSSKLCEFIVVMLIKKQQPGSILPRAGAAEGVETR